MRAGGVEMQAWARGQGRDLDCKEIAMSHKCSSYQARQFLTYLIT